MLNHHVHRNTAQVKPLAPRQHRHRHFADFGGGKDELDRLRGFFQRFQERVERVLGQHVDFINDVDLVAGR